METEIIYHYRGNRLFGWDSKGVLKYLFRLRKEKVYVKT